MVVIYCICEFFFSVFHLLYQCTDQQFNLPASLFKKKGEQMELLGRMREFGDTVCDDQIMQLT